MRIIKALLFFGLGVVVFVVGMKIAFPLPDQNFAEPSVSAPADWDGSLGQVIAPALDRHPDLNGIRPLADGRGAFAARAILARAATSSIDAQYYIWQDDTTGLMLLDDLRAAAERGVRVRLLVDDNGIPGLETLLAELDALPTADVRIFNPFTLRNPKLLSYAFDFRRLNRRMHNKSMTVDGVATIVGGRNIGDIYFSYGEGTHYFDIDAIAVGPIVENVRASFDAYWNSPSAYEAARVLEPSAETSDTLEAAATAARNTAAGAGYQQAIENSILAQELSTRSIPFEWGEATLFVDDPSKGLGNATGDQLLVEHLFDVIETADSSVDLVSAYFVPGPRGAELLERLAREGVRTRVLTNSLDATDVMPVHAAYAPYRPGLLENGVELLELRALRQERLERSLPEMLAGSSSGLHAKTFAFDDTRIFIGSFNLDPRSAQLNTEMGLLIESPSIARTLSEQLDNPSFAYRVELNADGDLIWVEDRPDGEDVTFTTEPNTTAVQRALATFVGWLPVEWML